MTSVLPPGSTSHNPAGGHGGGVRGDNVANRSPLFEGRFGRLFRNLPAASWSHQALQDLGDAMTSDPELFNDQPTVPAAAVESAEILQDDEENSGIPAGYTYFGQFVDHDITFDPASNLMKLNDPEALIDYRTPRLDLDNLYGRGPDDEPYMYLPDGKTLRLGRTLREGNSPTLVGRGHAVNALDLPRYTDIQDPSLPKRALIGDKRNDENVIVSQLQATMLQFHNKLVRKFSHSSFAEIQQLVRWTYQWLVLNDYLVKICGEDIVDELLPHRLEVKPAQDKEPNLHFFHYKNDPYMPVEFSGAAYRFGHSMVRPIYRLNTVLDGGVGPVATADEHLQGLAGRFFIFAGVKPRGLDGFDEFPAQWAIDWSLFFDLPDMPEVGGKRRVQPAYKIDTSMVNPLGFLPEFSTVRNATVDPFTVADLQAVPAHPPANLAVRNLLRGMALQLPSGQDVANAMGIPVVPDDQLVVCKATLGTYAGEDGPVTKVTDVSPSFAGNAPLWYYILAESQFEWFRAATGPGGRGDAEPVRLGSVGRRIVAETLIGLVAGDTNSYLRQHPNWKPDIDGEQLYTVGAMLQWALKH